MADSVIKYSDLIGQDDTFDVIFKNIEQLKKELQELSTILKGKLEIVNPNNEAQVQGLVKETENLANAYKKLEVEEKKARTSKKKLNDLSTKELIAREKEKIANREKVQEAKQLAILQNKSAGQIEKLRAQLSLTTMDWKKLTKEQIKNNSVNEKTGKTAKQVIKEKKKLTEQLKKLEKQTGDNRRNVGNYAKDLGKLGKVAAAVFIGRGIGQAIRNIGRAMGELIEKNKEANPELQKISDNFEGLKATFTGLGVGLLNALAPAINWFLEKLSLIPAFFSGIVAGSKQFGKNIKADFTKMGNSIKLIFLEIEKFSPFSDRTTEEIEANIQKVIKEQHKLTESQKDVSEAFNEAFQNSKKQVEAEKEQAVLAKKKEEAAKRRAETIKKQNALIQFQLKLQKNQEQRIKAIEQVEKEIEKLEINLIENKQVRLMELEELRLREIKEKRIKAEQGLVKIQEQQEKNLLEKHIKGSEAILNFQDKARFERDKLAKKWDKLEELELENSLNKKEEIRKQFQLKTDEIAVISYKDRLKKEEEAAIGTAKSIAGEQEKIEEDREEKRLKRIERIKETQKQIQETTEKIGALITQVFDKQSELAIEAVTKQADAVEEQRERAEKGLTSTLDYEQKQLAEREAERIKAEKKAKNVAEVMALYNLVSAHAMSGDKNALTRGLIDWSILKALSEALDTGFEEGGWTSDKGTKQIAGVVHGQEFVVTASDAAKYGLKGKSGAEFGEAMSDYFYSPLQQNLYPSQNANFKKGLNNQQKTYASLENEVKAMRKAFEDSKNNDFDILQMTDYFVEISKRVTNNRMTKVNKQRKRL